MSIKIRNPWSNERYSKKYRSYKTLTKYIIKIMKLLPDNYSKGWLGELNIRIKNINSFERGDIGKPSEVNLKPLMVSIGEFVPIEDVDQLKDGVRKLFSAYKPKAIWNRNDIEDVESFIESINNEADSKKWGRLGVIEFSSKVTVSQYVKFATIRLTHFSPSILTVQFDLELAEVVLEEIKKTIESDFKNEITTILTPTFRGLFRFWGSRGVFRETIKREKIEDIFLEVKWRFLEEIRKYLPIYLHKNNIVAPSIEVYKLEQKSSSLKGDSFWRSIGLDHSWSYEKDISEDGVWQFFSTDHPRSSKDNAIKITSNSSQRLIQFYHDIDSQIKVISYDNNSQILPLLILDALSASLSKKTTEYKKKLFKIIKKKGKRYQKLLDYRLEADQDYQFINSINAEISEKDWEIINLNISRETIKFEPSDRYRNTSRLDNLVSITRLKLKRANDNYEVFSKVVDSSIQIQTLSTNYKLQKRTVWLTVFTIFLTFVALYLTYLQIDQSKF